MANPKIFLSIALALASTATTMMFSGCEAHTPSNRSMESEDRGNLLQDGMGLLEVERALGCSGKPREWGRRVETPAEDPEVWSAEWRLSCVYEFESDSEVVAVFTAWTPEETTSNPPDSAYRLVSWSPRESTPVQSSVLWRSRN